MTAPAVSVVIATEGDRPGPLSLALMALGFQRFADFEVVVAGPASGHPRVRHVPAAPGNVSAARNAGIAAAAGGIVAFLDDDAVPEPGWLSALVDGFLAPDIGGVGGFVLGPDGVDWQARGLAVDRWGRDVALPVAPFAPPLVPDVPPGCVLKTPGTNCAFRRAALMQAGGFDAAFRFFHDETDLDRRLASMGWRLALAPRAVVHHGMAASSRRGPAGVPRDPFEVGASQALYLRRHAPEADREAALAGFAAQRRRGLVRQMLKGWLEPRDVARLMGRLQAGIAEGQERPFAPGVIPPAPAGGGRFPNPGPARGQRLLFPDPGPEALAAARNGAEVTVLRIGPGPRRLRAWFEAPGIWRHRGGAFGRRRRDEPSGPLAGRTRRIAAERDRIDALRGPVAGTPTPGGGGP